MEVDEETLYGAVIRDPVQNQSGTYVPPAKRTTSQPETKSEPAKIEPVAFEPSFGVSSMVMDIVDEMLIVVVF